MLSNSTCATGDVRMHWLCDSRIKPKREHEVLSSRVTHKMPPSRLNALPPGWQTSKQGWLGSAAPVCSLPPQAENGDTAPNVSEGLNPSRTGHSRCRCLY